MKGKYLAWLIGACILGIVVTVVTGIITSSSDMPSGITTSGVRVTPVAPTSKSPSPSTTTVTVTKPAWPTETASTLAPPPVQTTVPQTGHCVQDGASYDVGNWDTTADDNADVHPQFLGPLAAPSISTGPCFDKLVFTVNTSADVNFTAAYVPVVKADGSDYEVTDIKGGKFLQLTIRAHMLRDEQGNPLYNPADYNKPDVQGFGNPQGFGNLRELRLVTPDYEGYTTFGIGVDTMTPFAVGSHVIDGKTEVDVYITRPHR